MLERHDGQNSHIHLPRLQVIYKGLHTKSGVQSSYDDHGAICCGVVENMIFIWDCDLQRDILH